MVNLAALYVCKVVVKMNAYDWTKIIRISIHKFLSSLLVCWRFASLFQSLVEFCPVLNRCASPVWSVTLVKHTGVIHTSCSQDGAGVIWVYSHWYYTVFYTTIKLVLILVFFQEISVSYTNFKLVYNSDLFYRISWKHVIYFTVITFFIIHRFWQFPTMTGFQQ